MTAMKAGRELDALMAEKVFGCKVVWLDNRSGSLERCNDHCGGREPECHCVDPWTSIGIGLGEHTHFGPAKHDSEESERCRAIPEYSRDLALMVELVQDKWTDISMESSGLNWTVRTPIASVTDKDLTTALCLAALASVGVKLEELQGMKDEH